MKTNLKRTPHYAYLTQCDGLRIRRRIYTDGKKLFIKINDFLFTLNDIDNGKPWSIDFIH